MQIRLPPLSIVDVIGEDAAVILNNLTTNDIHPIALPDDGVPATGVETFVTNVKGKCVGHVMVYRCVGGFRLIGAGGQSEAIAAHADRYTIREDAVATIRDAEFTGWLTDETHVAGYHVPWLEPLTKATLRLHALADSAEMPHLDDSESVDDFHRRRIQAGFPWFGSDLSDSNLPQEANRDAVALSFTKGCYLGQETVARLDALGQVQKQLVRVTITGASADALPSVDTKLFAEVPSDGEDSRPVMRLTSVAVADESANDDVALPAIAMARRSHFEPGSIAHGVVRGDQGDQPIVATVAGTNS